MIFGIGNDIIAVERIEKILSKQYASRFVKRIFTVKEQKYCYDHREVATHFAGRWALKEAFYKALPPALQSFSHWHAIELVDGTATIKPRLSIIDEILQQKLDAWGITSIHHSISHEKAHAIAMVVLS